MQLLTDFGSIRWNRDVVPHWAVTTALDNVIRQLELAHIGLLPNLHLSPTLVVASDYSGQHEGATHEAFSFLIANLEFCWLWDEKRKAIRRTLFTDDRRMSYKALNDGQRRRALTSFLEAADWIAGVLITVLVDKNFIRSMLLKSEDRPELPSMFENWQSHVIQKLAWVSHLGALFVAGLSTSGQNVFWFTDSDDIVANDQRVIDLTPFLAGMIGNYSDQQMGHFKFGTTKCDNGDLMIEDLTSLPDLVAGALCEIPMRGILPRHSQVRLSVRGHVPSKAHTILAWLTTPRRSLSRLCFVVDEGDRPHRVRVRALEFWPD